MTTMTVDQLVRRTEQIMVQNLSLNLLGRATSPQRYFNHQIFITDLGEVILKEQQWPD